MVRDVFVRASIINLAWSKIQIFLTPHGCIHNDLVASIEECCNTLYICYYIGRFLALTITKTPLPKTMRGCGELLKLLSTDLSIAKIVSEYDQEIPQSQTTDSPVAPRGRAAQPS